MLVVIPKSSSGKPTVGASNDNLEAVPPLTLVPRLLCSNRRAPESAFEIRQAWRVWAVIGIWVECRVTLDVHVESFATVRLVTQRRTTKCVERCERLETHVLGGTQ